MGSRIWTEGQECQPIGEKYWKSGLDRETWVSTNRIREWESSRDRGQRFQPIGEETGSPAWTEGQRCQLIVEDNRKSHLDRGTDVSTNVSTDRRGE